MQARAASYAALIEEQLGQSVEFTPGRRGQFEVIVNGSIVASRKGGLIAKLTKRPWPSEAEVLAAVRKALPPSPPNS